MGDFFFEDGHNPSAGRPWFETSTCLMWCRPTEPCCCKFCPLFYLRRRLIFHEVVGWWMLRAANVQKVQRRDGSSCMANGTVANGGRPTDSVHLTLGGVASAPPTRPHSHPATPLPLSPLSRELSRTRIWRLVFLVGSNVRP